MNRLDPERRPGVGAGAGAGETPSGPGRGPAWGMGPSVDSVIFQTMARLLMPLLLLFSVIVLLVGHNEPGGGFVGGLVASGAVAMYSMAFGPARARALIRWTRGREIPLTSIVGVGLAMAYGSAVLGTLAHGGTFMQGWWAKLPVPLGDLEKIGTVVLFDVAVYVTVFGVVLLMLFELEEDRR